MQNHKPIQINDQIYIPFLILIYILNTIKKLVLLLILLYKLCKIKITKIYFIFTFTFVIVKSKIVINKMNGNIGVVNERFKDIFRAF